MPYPKTILNFFEKIKKLTFSFKIENEDGRVNSSILEKKILRKIRKSFPNMEIAEKRNWYDFIYKGYYFNLKITSGKNADNIFDKTAFIYSLQNKILKNMSFGKLYDVLTTEPCKKLRDYKEYYYLVLFKDGSSPLLRSICDLQTVNSNSNLSNVIQINWRKEREKDFVEKTIQEFKNYYLFLVKKSICGFKKRLGGFDSVC